ncbi:MAG: hypothetical protein AAGC63_05655 [Propionicimonas sp.]|nr:hypothetical protein [Propionicimonas sp.]
MDAAGPLTDEVSRRKVLTLAAAAALGAALAPGSFRLLEASASQPADFTPPGFRFLDSAEFGIRMAIPADLTAVRSWDLLEEDGAVALLEDLIQRVQPVTHDSLDDHLNSVDILAVSEDGTCVNVMRVGSADVPTPAMLAPEVEALRLTGVVFGHTETAFGPSTTMRGTTTVGEFEVPGYVLWARNRRGVFSVQVTAESDEVVDALYAIVVRTLQPIPGTR